MPPFSLLLEFQVAPRFSENTCTLDMNDSHVTSDVRVLAEQLHLFKATKRDFLHHREIAHLQTVNAVYGNDAYLL